MSSVGVDRVFERRLAALVNCGEPRLLRGGRRGLERESLRVTPEGRISQRMHSRALGSALTNPHITTDYSEALIELVTPTFADNAQLLTYLHDLHQFVYQRIDDESLWATSMPCEIGSDAEIPIAQFGDSHLGRIKHIYRHGLMIRYGGLMQAISGVHFNYSFAADFWPAYAQLTQSRRADAEFVSARYFEVLRNYRRYGWIVSYLFGVSPALCRSFLRGQDAADLVATDPQTLIGPYATSLRMSDLGYRNRTQAAVSVSVNSVTEYLRDLRRAIATPHAPFAALGVKVDGRYQQLSANALQIENEYYSYIRPKRTPRAGERTTQALERAGVEYVEVRALDNSAFDPAGVNLRKLCFLEAFLGLMLVKDSPPIDANEEEEIDRNHLLVARQGRYPGLLLTRGGRPTRMSEWAAEIIDSMQGICELLDTGLADKPHAGSLAEQAAKIREVERTPSARLLTELREHGESFAAFGLRVSAEHKEFFIDRDPMNDARQREFAAEAEQSLLEYEALESADRRHFDEYLAQYLAH